MRLLILAALIALVLPSPRIAQAAAQGGTTLKELERPSNPRLCTAVRATGRNAADKLNNIAADAAVKAKETLDATRTEKSIRECLSALSSLSFGADFQLRYPNIDDLLSRVVDRACQFVNQKINDEVYGLRSRFGTPGGYFGIEGGVTTGVGEVNVNTQDSSSYASNCVWQWLNGNATSCHN